MTTRVFTLISLFVFSLFSLAQTQPARPAVDVLLRCDDAGMSQGVNAAFAEIAESGLPFSASVMVPVPWFPEAVEIMNRYPSVSVGVHLTLNSEWKGLRWGPVLGPGEVPSLVDSLGYFFPTRASLMANKPDLGEVERELRAQVQRALKAGLMLDYVDYHMGAAVGTPELRAIVEKLADEFGVGVSRYFGEQGVEGLYRAPYRHKPDTLIALVNRLETGPTHLFVFHITHDTPEMAALIDQNTIGLSEVSKHRDGERRALLSDGFRAALTEKNVRLLTYRDLMRAVGRQGMKRPVQQ